MAITKTHTTAVLWVLAAVSMTGFFLMAVTPENRGTALLFLVSALVLVNSATL